MKSETPPIESSYSLLEDLRRVFQIPPLGTLILGLTTLCVFIGQFLGDSTAWAAALGLPAGGPLELLTLSAEREGQVIPSIVTLVTYMFMHTDPFHFLANLFGLWFFGIAAEPMLGTRRFLMTYLSFGVITAFAVNAIAPNVTEPVFGASGAIAGIVGVYAAVQFRRAWGQARGSRLVFILECLIVVGLATWFMVRVIPPRPNYVSTLVWHFIPFFLAWLSVRVKDRIGWDQGFQD